MTMQENVENLCFHNEGKNVNIRMCSMLVRVYRWRGNIGGYSGIYVFIYSFIFFSTFWLFFLSYGCIVLNIVANGNNSYIGGVRRYTPQPLGWARGQQKNRWKMMWRSEAAFIIFSLFFKFCVFKYNFLHIQFFFTMENGGKWHNNFSKTFNMLTQS